MIFRSSNYRYMPIFKKRNKSLYLLTNYKVMYSTLKHQKDLERIGFSSKTRYKILLNQWIVNKFKFYLIVRNPYDKVESFFREKFRKSLDYYENNGFWQVSQEIFFPYLGIEENMSSETIKKKLKDTTFSNMISILPNVYMGDGHLHPQYMKGNLEIRFFIFTFQAPIRIQKVCKLESVEDLSILKEIFGIDTDKKVNATSNIQEELMWTQEDVQIVNSLYKKDFLCYLYQMRK